MSDLATALRFAMRNALAVHWHCEAVPRGGGRSVYCDRRHGRALSYRNCLQDVLGGSRTLRLARCVRGERCT